MSWLLDPVTLWMVATRLTGFLVLAPAVSGQSIPRLFRALLVLWLALLLSPNVAPAPTPSLPWDLGWQLGTEFLLGLGFGGCLRLVFAAVELGASLIDSEAGFLAAQQFNPLLGGLGGAFTSLWGILALAYFWILDFFSLSIGALQQSFIIVPPGAGVAVLPRLEDVLTLSASIFTGALVVAAPLVALGFFVTVGLGLTARAVQGIQLFAESFVLRQIAIAVGLLGFLPLLLGLVRHQLDRALPVIATYFPTLPVSAAP